VSAQRIVVTSPWKLGLFVFLLVAACGFGLIYAYFGFFGGRLDFSDPEALRNFYAVCGSVAFLGLLGYLAVVSAAQPANLVANEGRHRRNLMKKAAKIDDPNQVNLSDFQDEPTLVAILERWRDDRKLVEAARTEALAQPAAPEMAPTLEGDLDPQSAAMTAMSSDPELVEPASAEDQLAAIHEELFHPQAAGQTRPVAAPQAAVRPAPQPVPQAMPQAAPQPTPAPQARDEEPVYDLSSFGAVELPAAGAAAARGERIYDLTEFGAVEL
jgi:hypothetical protein